MESIKVEVPQSTWKNFHIVKEPRLLFQYLGGLIGSYGCSSSQVSMDDFSDVSFSFPSSTTMPVDDWPMNFPAYDEHLQVNVSIEQESLNFQGSSTLEDQSLADEIKDVSDWLVSESSLLSNPHSIEDEGGSLHMSPLSSEASKNVLWNQTSLFVSTNQNMEVDESIFHLLQAYGEAIEIDCLELAEEISRKLQEKSCPSGSSLQRLAYYLFQALDKPVDILMEEARTNYEAAFKAFYQIFPYGRFAHFCSNSVILAALPNEAKVVHIVDFDVGSGVQWPPVIEALAMLGKKSVKLTTIKWAEAGFSTLLPIQKFEVTKLKLLEYARVLGLRMEVKEIEIEALMSELRKETTRGESKWLAFNCMVGLPHMGERRSISNAINFLKMAKDSIRGSNKGIITFGDGIGWGRGMTRNGYGHIFEGLLSQFQALLESMDCDFLQHLREARVAMECLFLKPYFISLVDVEMWKDISRESKVLTEIGLEAWKMQKDNLIEAKELVTDGEGSYWVTIEGSMENQMVLGYKGTPLVKVSSWR